jgi:hypothetical protein
MKKIFQYIALILCLMMAGCKKLIDVPSPNNAVTGENVFRDDATATAVLTGIYTQIANTGLTSQGLLGISVYPGLSADEFRPFGNNSIAATTYFTNSLAAANTGATNYWQSLYAVIYTANSAIAALPGSNTLTPAVRTQLLGEAKFIRAFCYFYLVNLYGDVPLALTTDYSVNNALSRSSATTVYTQIVGDLKEAQALLSGSFLDGSLLNASQERVRPSKWAAAALLARVYLYTKDWNNAALQAGSIITNTGFFTLGPLDQTFLRAGLGNNEAIWQIQPTAYGQNTPEGWLFIIPPSGPDVFNHPFYLNTPLLTSFESGDLRKTHWINSVTDTVNNLPVTYYYPYKYKNATLNDPVNEYSMVLRLAEQYLIRAEAEANGAPGGVMAAVSDLNAIRQRAGLGVYSGGTDPASLTTAILHERQVELFTEWGQRWLDLKRSGKVDAVMSVVTPQKGGTWNSYKQLYPIPLADVQSDSKLAQNPGY